MIIEIDGKQYSFSLETFKWSGADVKQVELLDVIVDPSEVFATLPDAENQVLSQVERAFGKVRVVKMEEFQTVASDDGEEKVY